MIIWNIFLYILDKYSMLIYCYNIIIITIYIILTYYNNNIYLQLILQNISIVHIIHFYYLSLLLFNIFYIPY